MGHVLTLTVGLFALLSTILSNSSLAASRVSFPEDFKWCVATAAHQIEGGNDKNDWWEWEQGEGRPQSQQAADHWNRVDSDIQLIQQINASTYRFSVEWSRVEPQEGVLDEEVIEHYRNEVELIEKAGIRPILTLNHFTFPIWVKNKGGWEWSGLPDAFGKFTDLVYQRIAPNVETWVTVNEPMNLILGGYVAGVLPPGEKRDVSKIIGPLRGILKSHAKAYHVLHDRAQEKKRSVSVGMALHLREMLPWNRWNPLDQIATACTRSNFNWTLPDAMNSGVFHMNLLGRVNVKEKIPGLEHTQDFIGINYYGGDFIRFSFKDGVDVISWDAATQPDPQAFSKGFYTLLKDVSKRYSGKPILITENGTTFDSVDGNAQSRHFIDHLTELSHAMEEGVPVQGYCYWTLYDNFEWGCGTRCPFGMYQTNFSTFERTPRPIARLFRQVTYDRGFNR